MFSSEIKKTLKQEKEKEKNFIKYTERNVLHQKIEIKEILNFSKKYEKKKRFKKENNGEIYQRYNDIKMRRGWS